MCVMTTLVFLRAGGRSLTRDGSAPPSCEGGGAADDDAADDDDWTGAVSACCDVVEPLSLVLEVCSLSALPLLFADEERGGGGCDAAAADHVGEKTEPTELESCETALETRLRFPFSVDKEKNSKVWVSKTALPKGGPCPRLGRARARGVTKWCWEKRRTGSRIRPERIQQDRARARAHLQARARRIWTAWRQTVGTSRV